MISSDTIGLWATGFWQTQLGSPPNVSALTLSGYVSQPDTLGTLNSFIGTCYSGSGFSGYGSVNYDVVPYIGNAELAIIGELYKTPYYARLAQSIMGYSIDTLPWVSLSEGDSKIGRANPASIGKTYLDMSNAAYNQMRLLINTYIEQQQGGTTPRDLEFYSVLGPIWGAGGYSQN